MPSDASAAFADAAFAVRRAIVGGRIVLLALVLVGIAPTALATFDEPRMAAAALGVVAALIGIPLLLSTRSALGHLRVLEQERAALGGAHDRVRLAVLRDALTGLGNHRAFQEELDEEIAAARGGGHPAFALLMIDIDDLKSINDQHGHAVGDEVLRTVAAVLRGNLRRGDWAFRVGGDEFAVVLAGSDVDGAHGMARRILAAALNGGLRSTGTPAPSLTIGVSAYPSPSTDRQQLVHHAEAALSWGKRHGRTDVQVFDPSRHGVPDDQRPLAEVAAAVSRVASGNLLRAVYQPIYHLPSGRPIGFEGLVRPADSAGFQNVLSMFIAAEATQRTVELDLAALRTVLAGGAHLPADAYLSVNLSPRTLEADAFRPQDLISMAARHGIAPSRLVVELTEREAVEDLDRLRQALSMLRAQGVRTAADDVGAGNAGLRLLSEVDFDIIKIDLSLVRPGARRDPSEAVLRALGDLARRQGRSIVAEGIETTDHLEMVLAMGIEAGQGFLLNHPGTEIDRGDIDMSGLAVPLESQPAA
jgi:diguanylate cyclase (GGDEF)-like protein